MMAANIRFVLFFSSGRFLRCKKIGPHLRRNFAPSILKKFRPIKCLLSPLPFYRPIEDDVQQIRVLKIVSDILLKISNPNTRTIFVTQRI